MQEQSNISRSTYEIKTLVSIKGKAENVLSLYNKIVFNALK